MVGAVIYILIWGFAAGWSAFGVRHSILATPALLLTFIIATILLSPVQGPLGIANSALVLVSIIIVGLAADLGGREQSAAKPAAARPRSRRRARADKQVANDQVAVIRRSQAAVSATPCSMV